MRMIAKILDCPFHLSIMTEEQAPVRSTAALEQEAIARTEAVEKAVEKAAAEAPAEEAPVQKVSEENITVQEASEDNVPVQDAHVEEELPVQETPAEEMSAADERDMTIGELYEIHKELSEMEKQPKKERFHPGNLFLRRKNKEENSTNEKPAKEETEKLTRADRVVAAVQEEKQYEDFEPDSVRMHPTRIGYVQVYDRAIHKWTDMTEWAFLGLQERKKALLGNAYEPPTYLD